jgi:hypothetical protein
VVITVPGDDTAPQAAREQAGDRGARRRPRLTACRGGVVIHAAGGAALLLDQLLQRHGSSVPTAPATCGSSDGSRTPVSPTLVTRELVLIRVWFDEIVIQPRRSQSLQIDHGLRKARSGVALLTPA